MYIYGCGTFNVERKSGLEEQSAEGSFGSNNKRNVEGIWEIA
jgi:hypothetical protein